MEPDALAGIDRLGRILAARGQHFRLIVVGGAALRLRGTITRQTEDVDVIGTIDSATGLLVPLGSPMPSELQAAASLVAHDLGLSDDWLNVVIEGQWSGTGPPAGMLTRLEWRTFGGLDLGLAGRIDLVALKLYAYVDHWRDGHLPNKHGADLNALSPTESEWRFAIEWTTAQDGTPGWDTQVREAVHDVRRRG